MRIKYLERKLTMILKRTVRKLRRIFLKKPDKIIRKLAYNLNIGDIQDFFSPKICYILTTKTRDKRANMSPIKWITEISYFPPLIAMSIFGNNIACENIKRYKSFTISMISNLYIFDFNRLIEIPGNKSIAAISRFRAIPAFFINGYMVRGFPWIECRLNRIININQNTSMVIGEIIHVSKHQLVIPDKLFHFEGDIFLNSKRLSIRKLSREKK